MCNFSSLIIIIINNYYVHYYLKKKQNYNELTCSFLETIYTKYVLICILIRKIICIATHQSLCKKKKKKILSALHTRFKMNYGALSLFIKITVCKLLAAIYIMCIWESKRNSVETFHQNVCKNRLFITRFAKIIKFLSQIFSFRLRLAIIYFFKNVCSTYCNFVNIIN